MLGILSTVYVTPSEEQMSKKLLSVTTAQYNSMAYPYDMLKSAEKNFEYYSLKNSYRGYKETEKSLIAVKHNPGFIQYTKDHRGDKMAFENLITETKILSKSICSFTNLKHGTQVDYLDFYAWQNKTSGDNGAKQKIKIKIIHAKLLAIWQTYFKEYQNINYILSQPNKNTGELNRSLIKYEKSIIDEKYYIFLLIFPNENFSAICYKNRTGNFIKKLDENWEKFNPRYGFGLTDPTHAIKIEYTGGISELETNFA